MVVDENVVKSGAGVVFDASNNVCEYTAVIEGIKAVDGMEFDEVEIVSDSQLIINQIAGGWKINNLRLKDLHTVVMGVGRRVFGSKDVKFTWNSRESKWTQICDKMCDDVIDGWRE